MKKREIFLKIALGRIPFILSLQDRNPFSPSYGSFDREYWQYKKTDVPYASVQGAIFSLALLYKNKLPNNPYFKNKRILEWIIAGLKYLEKIQKNDGCFDEYYPNEKSYIGTALTMYPCAKAFILVKEEINSTDKKTILKTFQRAADYLAKNFESKVLNQEMLAALTIYSINQVLKKEILRRAFEKKINFVINSQNKEGWFPEYEGCDVGYLSYTIDFLAAYYKESKNKRVIGPLNKAIEFISYFLHPNGTAGGEYTARNTEYLVPSGFEVMSKINPISKSIIEFIEKSLFDGSIIDISRLDNRYTPLYIHQYLQTFIEAKRNKGRIKREGGKEVELPFQRKDFSKYFKQSGLKFGH